MKKKRLISTDPLEDAVLLGITSALKAHKLAWLINQTATLRLAKVVDLYFEAPVRTVHFLFKTEHCTCSLIKNRVMTGEEESMHYLIPSLKHVDFFFAVRDFTQTFNADVFCRTLKATKRIEYIADLDLETYKDKAHLFFP